MKLPEHIRSRANSAYQGQSYSDPGKTAKGGGGQHRLKWAPAAVFFGAVIVCVILCVVSYRHVAHEWKAIQGQWITVRGDLNVSPSGSQWHFSSNGWLDHPGGGRFRYSINPMFHTIEWRTRDSIWASGTYELNGDDLKIWVRRDTSKTLYVLKRA